jgi:protein-disulfide isomerase
VDVLSVAVVAVAIALLVGRVVHGRLSGSARNDGGLDRELFVRLASDGQWIGSRTASAVILVYSDYGCGFCAELNTTLDALMKRYPDHVAVAIKHFVEPSSLKNFRVPAGAECAGDQGRFVEYHNAAFQNTNLLRYSDGWRVLADLADVADREAFALCVNGGRYDDRIMEQYEEGMRLGVTVTPTLFVNGSGVVGAASLDALDSLVAKQFPDRR